MRYDAGKYCRRIECRVYADEGVAGLMNRETPGYTSSLMSSFARPRHICVREWPLCKVVSNYGRE